MRTPISRVPRIKLSAVQGHLLGFALLLLGIVAVATAPFTIGPAVQSFGRVVDLGVDSLTASWTGFWAAIDGAQKAAELWLSKYTIASRTAAGVFAVGTFWWLGAAGSAERMGKSADIESLRAGEAPPDAVGTRRLMRIYYAASASFFLAWGVLLWLLPSNGYTLLENAFTAAGGIPPLLVMLVSGLLLILSWLPLVLAVLCAAALLFAVAQAN